MATCLLLAACTEHDKVPVVAGGDARLGKALAARYQCGSCHRIPDIPAGRAGMGATLGPTLGPPLDQFGRHSYIAGSVPNLPGPLIDWLVDPAAVKPGTSMPAMGVSRADARHLAAYLYTLR